MPFTLNDVPVAFSYLLDDALHFSAQLRALTRRLLVSGAALLDLLHHSLHVKSSEAGGAQQRDVKQRGRDGAQAEAAPRS